MVANKNKVDLSQMPQRDLIYAVRVSRFSIRAKKARLPFFVPLVCLVLLPAKAAQSADGAKLYAQNCAACHGTTGHGGVGVPLSLPDFLATVDDNYLRETIRVGRPGRVMPAFARLGDAEIEAIVTHIRSWQTKPAFETATVRPGSAVRGAELFAKHCASCHGTHGEGGHGTGVTFSRPRDLPVLAPALNNPGFLASASDAMLKSTLMRGRQGTPMLPAQKLGLRERAVDDIVAHVRAFGKAPLARDVVDLEREPAVLMRESPYSIEETVEKLKVAVNAANMRLIRVEPFDKGFVPEGRERKTHVIVDACDFEFLNDALKVDPRIGLFLPCRFTVLEHDGRVYAMSVNPKRLGAIFNNRELDQLCTRMKQVYTGILEEGIF